MSDSLNIAYYTSKIIEALVQVEDEFLLELLRGMEPQREFSFEELRPDDFIELHKAIKPMVHGLEKSPQVNVGNWLFWFSPQQGMVMQRIIAPSLDGRYDKIVEMVRCEYGNEAILIDIVQFDTEHRDTHSYVHKYLYEGIVGNDTQVHDMRNALDLLHLDSENLCWFEMGGGYLCVFGREITVKQGYFVGSVFNGEVWIDIEAQTYDQVRAIADSLARELHAHRE
ncbi:hypothetical protein ACP3V3_19750 [Vibrio sp. PNB22_3_1]